MTISRYKRRLTVKGQPLYQSLFCVCSGLFIIAYVNGYDVVVRQGMLGGYPNLISRYKYDVISNCPKEYGLRVRFEVDRQRHVAAYFSYYDVEEGTGSFSYKLSDIPTVCKTVEVRYSLGPAFVKDKGDMVGGELPLSNFRIIKLKYDGKGVYFPAYFPQKTERLALGRFRASFQAGALRPSGAETMLVISTPLDFTVDRSWPNMEVSNNVWLQNDYAIKKTGEVVLLSANVDFSDSRYSFLKDILNIVGAFLLAKALEYLGLSVRWNAS